MLTWFILEHFYKIWNVSVSRHIYGHYYPFFNEEPRLRFLELLKIKGTTYGRPGLEPHFFIPAQFSDSKSWLAKETPVELSKPTDTRDPPQIYLIKELWGKSQGTSIKKKISTTQRVVLMIGQD